MPRTDKDGKEIGEDGYFGLEENECANRSTQYACYLDLTKIGYSQEAACDHMSITMDTLESIIKEFG